jgi:hypothetical protein
MRYLRASRTLTQATRVMCVDGGAGSLIHIWLLGSAVPCLGFAIVDSGTGPFGPLLNWRVILFDQTRSDATPHIVWIR